MIAGCSNGPAATHAVPAVSIEATNQGMTWSTYRYVPSTLQAQTGAAIAVKNTGDTQHTSTITGTSIDISVFPGTTDHGVLNLQPGTYQFFCTVREIGFTHAEAGMIGTLTVTAGT